MIKKNEEKIKRIGAHQGCHHKAVVQSQGQRAGREQEVMTRSKSVNNIQSPEQGEQLQSPTGRINLKAHRSLSSNNLFASPQSPTAKSISVSERIRNARPVSTTRERDHLSHASPSKSFDYSTENTKLASTKSLDRSHSYCSPSRESPESITAILRRKKQEYLKSKDMSPPPIHPVQRTPKKSNEPIPQPTEKKGQSITRMLTAAGLQRQRKKNLSK